MDCTMAPQAVAVLDASAFHQGATDWQDLLERSYDNRIFLSPAWHQVWWDHFGSGSLNILTLRDAAGVLTGLLPLTVQERAGGSTLTLLGDHHLADYMDGAAVKSDAASILVDLWREAFDRLTWDHLELRHVPSASPLVPALQAVATDRGLTLQVEPDEVCPVALLCNTWDGYLQMLNKKQRHEIRRKLRRSQEGAEWSWRTVETASDLERDLPVFFRLHEASAGDKAQFMTPAMQAFFGSIAGALLQAGILRLSTFARDGVDIASTMCFFHRDRYLLYNSGYDPAYAVVNPGIAAVAMAMQAAIAERAVAFDFLSGDDPYKYQFGASNTHTCQIELSRGALQRHMDSKDC